jgi:fatty acid kinase fatty acid binding subunit
LASVAILTDSTADLTPAQAAGAGITVVPLYVRFGAEEFRAGVDLSTEAFWQKLLAAGAAFPTTSAPSPGDFAAAFNAAFTAGAEAIVCPTIGQKLSATYQGATLAAQSMPDREIHVIDTGSTSMSTGIPALMASELAAAGASAKEIADEVTRRLPDVDLFVAADGLEYLRKGGRLSATRAVVGTMLSVKPIVTVRDGLVVLADKERSRAKARATVIRSIAQARIERLAILHTPTSTPDEVAAFREQLLAAIPGGVDPARITVGLVGASTGPHLGPDLMGASFLRAR